jgi:hypothetical protein
MVQVHATYESSHWLCQVSVNHAGQHSRHAVTVRRADLERWAAGTQQKDVEDLVKRSFVFLLEREPPSSILATFELSTIPRYFPEFDSAFRRR